MRINKKRAFTLIEISIVLVIIGIILASVMKGRDLIKSSQIKEFNQVFVNQWETIANSYFSRMAAPVGDGSAHGATGTSNGFSNNGRNLATASVALTQATALKDAGIDPCTLIRTDVLSTGDAGCDAGDINPFSKTVDGEFSGKTTVTVRFGNFLIDGKRKNAVVFMNIPYDVGQAIDTMKDGSANGKKGSVLALLAPTAITGIPTANPGEDLMDGSGIDVVDWNDSAATTNNRHMIILLEH